MILDLALGDNIFINDTIDAAVQELDILFNTANTELIGNVDYGTNFEQFLWNLNPSEESLKSYVYEKINSTYFLAKMKVDVDVSIEDGTHRNIYNVTITVNYPEAIDSTHKNMQKRVYQFR